MTTEEGTVATAVLLLDNVTVPPPLGARPVIVTVPVEVEPPFTEVGFRVRVDSVGRLIVRVAVREVPA